MCQVLFCHPMRSEWCETMKKKEGEGELLTLHHLAFHLLWLHSLYQLLHFQVVFHELRTVSEKHLLGTTLDEKSTKQ